MCLILAAWQAHPQYPLVIAANRDEFFARPTRSAFFWPEAPNLLAGRDLSAGGTWLGITRGGRFAALTNFRDPTQVKQLATSRGSLVTAFLQGTAKALDYLADVKLIGDRYNGFNLLVCDGDTLACYNNIENQARNLNAGVHGLSNHVINTPWPKVTTATHALEKSLHDLPDTDGLFHFLRDTAIADDIDLPDTGVPLEWERRLSAIFVRATADSAYGTRSSTVLVVGQNNEVFFDEQEWNADAAQSHRQRFRFTLDQPDHGRPTR
ncbi:D71 [Georgfuchsia toluolica]|uniref:D71 n=1 Tax=Georgfuchsia toluolica TaxID=424218 RepID=A0A916N8P6_9PROT|nr:NRDE family protein [Georgfuchsia toluolica]CAG4882848.1 D71 [Georgfuchsia toluolica]